MKILEINKFFYLRSGVERHLFDATKVLEEHGHDVVHFSMQDKRNIESPYSKYFVSNISFDPPTTQTVLKMGRIFYSFEARRKLAKLIKKEKPDVAHVHLLYHHLSPSLLHTLKKAGIPVVMTIHDWQLLNPNYYFSTKKGPYTVEHGRQYWRCIKDRAIKGSIAMSTLATGAAYLHKAIGIYGSVNTFIAPSNFAKELFIKSGWESSKIEHVPHFFKDLPELGQVKKQPYLLYAGRLKWEKGVDQLLHYWADYMIPFTLKIAGKGPQERELKKIIKEKGLEDRVELLGFLEKEQLGDYMAKAAAIVQPTIMYETFGLAVLEAWSHKTKAFVHNRGSIVDFAQKSSAATEFSLTSAQFCKDLHTYMDNETLWYEDGQKGRNMVEKEYSEALWYKRMNKIYESLVS